MKNFHRIFRRFRPEFLMRYQKPLSPDAVSGFEDKTSAINSKLEVIGPFFFWC
jgi:hypothetical protein